ncbi:MAG: helix-turn-helix domain-containing protein [Gemmatimonadetes bacterium]|nr:helix-turn-helix domain-containing protein [Gemmatimonadota bacterium]
MTAPRTLSGYRGIRGEILVALKKAQPLTARDLADRFDLTANALRRHLDQLEADGVVQHGTEARGVGAPVYTYALTPDGEALFPSAYVAALVEALETVRQHAGTAGVIDMFKRRWTSLAKDARPELERLPLHERTALLASLLSEQGYMAEAGAHADGHATLTEHNCAIKAAAERYPEICDAETEFLELMLGGRVERQAHILKGCNACEYTITPIGAGDASLPLVTLQKKPAAGAAAPSRTTQDRPA